MEQHPLERLEALGELAVLSPAEVMSPEEGSLAESAAQVVPANNPPDQAAAVNIGQLQLLVGERQPQRGDTRDFLDAVRRKLYKSALYWIQIEKVDVNKEQDQDGNKAVHIATRNEDQDIFSLLMLCGADINAINLDFQTPLFVAINYRLTNFAKYLLSQKANAHMCTVDPITPLLQATINEMPEICELILSIDRPKLDIANSLGTPLHHACRVGNMRLVRLFVKEGRELLINNRTHYRHWTPLFEAVEFGDVDIVTYLLNCGAQVNLRDPLLRTPLHYAAEKDHFEICIALLNRNAEINAPDFIGNIPLHLAGVNDNRRIFQLLINKHSDRKCKHYLGRVPHLRSIFPNYKDGKNENVQIKKPRIIEGDDNDNGEGDDSDDEGDVVQQFDGSDPDA